MATEVFVDNPNHGHFNPGTESGCKIFKKKTKGLPDDKRIRMRKDEAPKLRRYLETKTNDWGTVCSLVPIEFDSAGNAIKHANLLTGYGKDISLELVQRNAI